MKFKPWRPRPAVDLRLGEQSRVFNLVTAIIGPAYARFVLRLGRVAIEGREGLVEQYRRSVADEGRFIVAYRHPGDADPHLVYLALTNMLRGEAPATEGDGRPGAWYPSGTEVQIWASPLVLWALRNAGIVPVRHGAVERAVLDYLVRGVAERRRPMAIAPEGMATYHRDLVAELDPGTVRIAALAAERLAGEDRHLPLVILPLAIDYDYGRTTSPARLGAFLSRLERRLARPGEAAARPRGPGDLEKDALRDRILACWERIVAAAEAAYARSWGLKPAPAGTGLRARLTALLDQSVSRLEAFYGVTPAPSLKARVLNIRAEAIDRVFYAPAELASQSPLERAMAGRGAAEAYMLDQVYLVAALGQFLDPAYIEGDPDFDRLVETAVNLDDVANRLEGKGMRARSKFFLKDARLIVGRPVAVDRRPGESRRAAVERVEAELEAGFRLLAGGSGTGAVAG